MYHLSVYTLSLFVLCLSGCGGDGNGGKDQDDTGDTSTSTVPEDCAQYLECMAVVDADNMDLYEATYGEDGECWSGSNSDQLTCTQACQVGMETAHAADPAIEECWSNGTPDMQWVFPYREEWSWRLSGSCELSYQDVYSEFYDGSGSEFSIEFGFSDGGEMVFDTTCTETGWEFACDRADPLGGAHLWDLSGVFSDGFRSAVMDVVYTHDGEEIPCTYEGDEE